MPPRGNRKGPKKPRFPRRQWKPGQTERAAKLKKGGGYDRIREKRRAEEDVKEETP